MATLILCVWKGFYVIIILCIFYINEIIRTLILIIVVELNQWGAAHDIDDHE